MLLILLFLSAVLPSEGQGFLHADGKRIIDAAGANVILRGIGTGNWMLQEGYMMQTADIAPTQHQFRDRLIQSIGQANTDSFYTVWLDNHCTRTDVDSLASWGFNSVRVAMHYKWFTLPIEEEPVPGVQTWLGKGFQLIDSLLDWCGDNRIYLILDLHGAPGGQGKEAAISDYDPSKHSLWESQANKDKTVALWDTLAARYRDEPWIGGYDLINETNWTFPEGNNSQLKALFVRITDSIRAVDPNHIIIIEGNGFANDYSLLTPPWDPNMVYSFHKYWTYNDASSLNWIKSIRDTYQVPIWLGESGENSNTWFTNLIALCESNNIGWSWWPLKKAGINNPLRVAVNDDYVQLTDSWRGTAPQMDPDEAFQAVLTFADRHRIGRCIYQKDVVDAMIRQPHTTGVLPFAGHPLDTVIFAAEYDLGRNGFAYADMDTADYHGSMNGQYTNWNQGWSFRNDGVDLEPCLDSNTNGYNVGWTEGNEWLGYSLVCDSAGVYTLEVRSASQSGGAQIHLEVNGVDATGPVTLPATGGWQTWITTQAGPVILPRGALHLKVAFDRGGSNLNWFRLSGPGPDSLLPFEALSAQTSQFGEEVLVNLNKEVSPPYTFNVGDFTLTQNSQQQVIDRVDLSGEDNRVLVVTSHDPLFYNQPIRISYSGNSIRHDGQMLEAFSSMTVNNLLARHFAVPGRIQAESFLRNNGLELESCSDLGGGTNTGYANVGDYLDYMIYVAQAGEYTLDFRVATERYNSQLAIQKEAGSGFSTLKSMKFTRTGGWQTWTTQSTVLSLDAGKYLFRLLVTGEEHNLNWIEFKQLVSTGPQEVPSALSIYPNPADGHATLDFGPAQWSRSWVEITDGRGSVVYRGQFDGSRLLLDTSAWPAGLYLVRITGGGGQYTGKLIVN
jgi:hypothetical protein